MLRLLLAFGLLLSTVVLAEDASKSTPFPGVRERVFEHGTIRRYADGVLGMTMKGSRVWVKIDTAGFSIDDSKADRNGISFISSNRNSGLLMSAFLEPVDGTASSQDCREYYFPRALSSPVEKSDDRRIEDGNKSIGAYRIDEAMGEAIHQEHRNVYLYKSGYCVDVHISKMNYRSKDDEVAFQSVIASLDILDHAPPPSSQPPNYKLEFGQISYDGGSELKMTFAPTGVTLSVALDDFALLDMGSNPNGLMFTADSRDDKMRVYGFLQPEKGVVSAADCRALYMADIIKKGVALKGIVNTDEGARAIADYESAGGDLGNNFNRKIFMFDNGHCSDVHLVWHAKDGVPVAADKIIKSARVVVTVD